MASPLDEDTRRKLAAELFNHTWTLLDKPDRSERETDLMVHAAHASRFLWEGAGGPVNHARGEWQVARAYAVAVAGRRSPRCTPRAGACRPSRSTASGPSTALRVRSAAPRARDRRRAGRGGALRGAGP